jgi:hypothetical protein
MGRSFTRRLAALAGLASRWCGRAKADKAALIVGKLPLDLQANLGKKG